MLMMMMPSGTLLSMEILLGPLLLFTPMGFSMWKPLCGFSDGDDNTSNVMTSFEASFWNF
jgi:hypothetical protein